MRWIMGRGRATETLLGSSIILSLILAVYRDDAGRKIIRVIIHEKEIGIARK